MCASELAYLFPKCQCLFKPCFAYVPTTMQLYMFAYFIYAAHSNSQGEPKIASFPATTINLPTILHGCYLGGSNITSASQSYCHQKLSYHRTRSLLGGEGEKVNGRKLTCCKPYGCVTYGCWVYGEYMGPGRQERG